MSIKSLNVLSYYLAGFSILLIIFGCLAPVVFTQCNSCVDFTETGQIGDTIGGTMSPIVAIAGVFMTFIAFLMQINANRIQSEQLKKSFNLRLLENKIESRNALQLMSVDINDMIKDIDLICKWIDSNLAGDMPFCFSLKQSRYRYTSIDRNLVYSAFSFFMMPKEESAKEKFIDDFRAAYSLMGFYSEGIDSLYSNVYIPYMDEIENIKKQMQYVTKFELIQESVTQEKMMISAMRDAKEKFLKKEAYERLKQLGNKIEIALSKNTIESIQEEFDKQI